MNNTIGLIPKRVFGLRSDVAGNVHFLSGEEICYPAAGVLVIQHCITSKQRYLRFPANTQPEIIVISPNRQLLAVTELNLDSKQTLIVIYDLKTLKKFESLSLPPECPVQAVSNMCFTTDSKGISVLSQEPNAFVTYYTFGKSGTMVFGRASKEISPGQARCVQCSPSDLSIIAVGGENLLKIMNRTDKTIAQIGATAGDNIAITSLTFLNGDIVIAGSAEMELCFFEGGELKAKLGVNKEVIDLGDLESSEETCVEEATTENFPILCLTTFPVGFVFATNNNVHMYEKENPYKFNKKSLLTIPVDFFDESLYVIKSVSINDQQDTIVATTRHSQIYVAQLYVTGTMKLTKIDFKFLSEPLHIDSILDLSVCAWQNIAMTASKDRTVRIWNYSTMKLELLKTFRIEPRIVALHPSGFFAAIAFNDMIRFVQVQLNDLKVLKVFGYSLCKTIKFSNLGHLFAIGCDDMIAVISVFTLDTVMELRGHQQVLSLAWSSDDKYLMSSGEEGSLYEWDISLGGKRINDFVEKRTLNNSIAAAFDQSYILSVTASGYLREIRQSQLVREFRAPEADSALTTLAFSRSNKIMFTANDRGFLYNVKLPFLGPDGGTFYNHRFYLKAINRLCITPDDEMLISVGADGTLVFWSITNAGDRISSDEDSLIGTFDDILISRKDLSSKVHEISALENRLVEQQEEFMFKNQQGSSLYSDQMQEINEKYEENLLDLKRQNATIQASHIDEMNEMNTTLVNTNEQHRLVLKQNQAKFNEKLIIEYEKQEALENALKEMKEMCEENSEKSRRCLHETIVSYESSVKAQLDERQDFVNRLLSEIEQKEKEFEEYRRQEEVQHDRQTVELKVNYEKRLKEAEEILSRWKVDVAVLKKKNISIDKERQDLQKEIEVLELRYARLKEIIRENQAEIENLKVQRNERDDTIYQKEKELVELKRSTQVLEKYKQAQAHKMYELKNEIEPREKLILLKNQGIAERERELLVLENEKISKDLEISELREKYLESQKQVSIERSRAKASRGRMINVCSEIYKLSCFVQQPAKLKEEVVALYHRYGNEREIEETFKRELAVRDEFERQRHYYEKKLSEKVEKDATNRKESKASNYVKLLKENVTLIAELNRLREDLNNKEKELKQTKSMIVVHQKLPSSGQKKLAKAPDDRQNSLKKKI